jgi:hypothetical protein
VPRERPRPEVLQPELQRPVWCPEAARLDVPVDRLAHLYREAVRPAYAAAARSRDFHLQEAQQSEVRPSEAPSAVSAPVSAWCPKAARAAEAEVSSAASAQPGPSSQGAAAVGVAAYVRAVPPRAEPVGPDAREQGAVAVQAASDARAQPREAAAEPGAEPEEAAEPDAEPEAEVGAAVLDAALQPGVAEAAARDAVLRPGAAVRVAPARRPVVVRPSAAPSAFHRGQALPWLAP